MLHIPGRRVKKHQSDCYIVSTFKITVAANTTEIYLKAICTTLLRMRSVT